MKKSCWVFNLYILIATLSTCLTSCINFPNPPQKKFFKPEIVKQLQKYLMINPGTRFWLEVTVDGSPVVPGGIINVSLQNVASLPYLEDINCAGLTLENFSQKIIEAYGTHYNNPMVMIHFLEGVRGIVGVYGCVGREGVVNLPNTWQLTLTQAIQYSGDLTPQANRKRIQIMRTLTPRDLPQLKEKMTQTMEFDYDAILSGKIPDPPLIKDDVVRVLDKIEKKPTS